MVDERFQAQRKASNIYQWHQRTSLKVPHRYRSLSDFPYLNQRKRKKPRPYMLLLVVMLLGLCGGYAYLWNSAFTPSDAYAERIGIVPSQTPLEAAPSVDSVPRSSTASVIPQRILPTAPPTMIPMTPTPTMTATPTLTPTPTVTPFPGVKRDGVRVVVRLGWFYPPYGGSHCPNRLPECDDLPLLDGQGWYLRVGQVAACPPQFPLFSWFHIPQQGAWQCVHDLDLADCDLMGGVCNVLILSPGAIVPDWTIPYDALLYVP